VPPQRRRHDVARILANRLPARQAQGRARRPREGPLDHPVRREQVSEAVDIPAQDQAAAFGQDIGGRGGWHAAPVPEVSGTPEQAAEQILATLADRLANEPVASLTILRSMLTNPEAASVISEGMTRYQAQIAQAIPAGDASLRAALISAIILGVTVSRHLIKSDELASADPAQIISLLRPGMISLAAQPPSPPR
jgi:hypothetical protein